MSDPAEDNVLFAPRVKSLVLHLPWRGHAEDMRQAPGDGGVPLCERVRSELLQLDVDVVVVTRGNYELVLPSPSQPVRSREMHLIESLKPENIKKYNLPNYTVVARALYSRKLQGEQPDSWRHFRAGVLEAAEGRSAPPEALAGLRLGAVMVANALNNGWMEEAVLATIGLRTRHEMQALCLMQALNAADVPLPSFGNCQTVTETARLVLEKGRMFVEAMTDILT